MFLGIPRFDDKISPEPNTGCWLWTGAVAGNGYPSFKHCGSAVGAHCFAYRTWRKAEIAAGRPAPPPLRKGQKLMHKCDTPLCCNPLHHKPGSHMANMRDMIAKGRGKGQWTPETRPVPRGTITICSSCGGVRAHTVPLCQCCGYSS
jgi:hypothetical protein